LQIQSFTNSGPEREPSNKNLMSMSRNNKGFDGLC
jgi:hypothetical protein